MKSKNKKNRVADLLRTIPGFSSGLLLIIPVNWSCLSMWFDDPRRLPLRNTQLLTSLHQPPPWIPFQTQADVKPNWHIATYNSTKCHFHKFICDSTSMWNMWCSSPQDWRANCLLLIQTLCAGGNLVGFHPSTLQWLSEEVSINFYRHCPATVQARLNFQHTGILTRIELITSELLQYRFFFFFW